MQAHRRVAEQDQRDRRGCGRGSPQDAGYLAAVDLQGLTERLGIEWRLIGGIDHVSTNTALLEDTTRRTAFLQTHIARGR